MSFHPDFNPPGFAEFADPPQGLPDYAQTITALPGLALYYRFSQTAGQILDLGPHGLHASPVGNFTYQHPSLLTLDDDPAGHFNQAYIQPPDHPALHITQQLTLLTSVTIPDDGNEHKLIAAWADVTSENLAPDYSFLLSIGSDRRIIAAINSGQTLVAITEDSLPVDSTHHLAMTYTSTTGVLTVYIDGAAEANAQWTPRSIRDFAIPLRIGAGSADPVNEQQPHLGPLDEVAFLNQALSPQAIRSLHQLAAGH